MAYINRSIEAIVIDFPAYTVVSRQKNRTYDLGPEAQEYIDIVAGESLCFARKTPNHGVLYSQQVPNSIVSYAMKNGDCPIAGLDRARQQGDKLHWVSECSVILSAEPQAKEVWTLIEDGDLVRFEGQFFKIKTFGRNVVLVK